MLEHLALEQSARFTSAGAESSGGWSRMRIETNTDKTLSSFPFAREDAFQEFSCPAQRLPA